MSTRHTAFLLEKQGADRLAGRLTLAQLDTIVKDTRLPGEIAYTYGVTAGVIARIQHRGRVSKARGAAVARQRLEAAKAKSKPGSTG
jgi:hypothetical protein